MKCPLSTVIDYEEEGNPLLHHQDCLKGDCAWWYIDGARCSMLDLCLTLNTIDLSMQDISDRLERGANPRL